MIASFISKKILKLTLLVLVSVITMIGTVSALLLTHVHNQIGVSEQTTNFTPNSTKHTLAMKAPSSGGMSVAIRLNGENMIDCSGAHGAVCCEKGYLAQVQHQFFSFADITTGIGTAWVWDTSSSLPTKVCEDTPSN